MIIITQSFLLYRQMVHLSNDSDEKKRIFPEIRENLRKSKNKSFFIEKAERKRLTSRKFTLQC